MKKLCIILLINSLLLSAVAAENANDTVKLEDKLKAVFIFNFTKYIQWANNDTSGSFKIGVIGDSDIIIPLKEIGETESVNSRKIEIKLCQNLWDTNDCNILFISASEKNKLQDILKKSRI